MAFYGSRFFSWFQVHFLWVFKVPGWFFMVENTPKDTSLICILAPRAHDPARPSDDDDDDDDDCDDKRREDCWD